MMSTKYDRRINTLVERLEQYERLLTGQTERLDDCEVCSSASDAWVYAGRKSEEDVCEDFCLIHCCMRGSDVRGSASWGGTLDRQAAYKWYRTMITRANKRLRECGSNWRIQGMTKKQLGI